MVQLVDKDKENQVRNERQVFVALYASMQTKM